MQPLTSILLTLPLMLLAAVWTASCTSKSGGEEDETAMTIVTIAQPPGNLLYDNIIVINAPGAAAYSQKVTKTHFAGMIFETTADSFAAGTAVQIIHITNEAGNLHQFHISSTGTIADSFYLTLPPLVTTGLTGDEVLATRLNMEPLSGHTHELSGPEVEFTEDGIKAQISQWGILTAVLDTGTPDPGGEGALTTSAIEDTSVTLTWERGSDDVCNPSNLEYRLYQSTQANLTTLAEIEANGIPLSSFARDMTTLKVTGLYPETAYYFSVIVRDVAKHKAAYVIQTATTTNVTDIIPPEVADTTITSSNITDSAIDLSWNTATDDLTSTANIEYCLYTSTLSDLENVTDIDSNGTLVGSCQTSFSSYTFEGLAADFTFYANLVAKDEGGNKTSYSKVTLTTLKAPLWRAPIQISDGLDTKDSYNAQVAVDDNGNAMVVWNKRGASFLEIYANYYDAATGWTGPTIIEAQASHGQYPTVAFSSDGKAMAVWRHGNDVRSNIYTPGVGWGTDELVESDGQQARYTYVKYIDADTAIAVWEFFDGSKYNIYANVYNGGWGVETAIEAGGATAYAIDLAAGNGKLFAVWEQHDGSQTSVFYNIYDGAWGGATQIETDNINPAREPKIAANASGKAAAVWKHNASFDVMYNYYDGTSWGTPIYLEAGSDPATNPEVSITDNGRIAATWEANDGGRKDIWANIYDGSSWSGEALIETDDTGTATLPKILMDASGSATAVWQHVDGSGFINIQCSGFRIGTGWSSSQLLEKYNPAGSESNKPNIELGGNRTAVAAWNHNNGGGDLYRTFAALYIPDSGESPIAGASGAIAASGETAATVDLDWSKASDAETARANLYYAIFYSTANNLGSVATIEANGTYDGIYYNDLNAHTVTGLSAATTYYFNIIVTDQDGMKAAYTTVSTATTP